MAKETVNNARKFQSFTGKGGREGYPGYAERAQESGEDISAPSPTLQAPDQ